MIRSKKAILDKFEINAETYRRRFRANTLKQGETPKELQARLKDLYDKWITPKDKTKEEIGEMIVLEQFLRVINPEIRTWICEHNPTSSRQAAELAETFIAARQSTYQLGYSQGSTYNMAGKSGKVVGGGLHYNFSKGPSSQTLGLPQPDSNDFSDIPHNIAELQKQDVTLKSLFERATTSDIGKFQDRDHFIVKRDMLYRKTDDGDQLVIPLSMRAKVLQIGHSIPWAGHLGQQKTLARIASRFYWPHLYMDVIDFCKSCSECQLTATVKKGDRAPLVSLPIIDVPFTRVAMDVVGPLERS